MSHAGSHRAFGPARDKALLTQIRYLRGFVKPEVEAQFAALGPEVESIGVPADKMS